MTESPPRSLCHYTGQPQFALTYNNSSSTIVANDVSCVNIGNRTSFSDISLRMEKSYLIMRVS